MSDNSQLIDAFLAGDLTDEQWRQLEAWLQKDPRHVEQFATACLLESQLVDIVGQRQLQKNAAALGRAASPSTPAASHARTWMAAASSRGRGLIRDFSREPLAVAILVLVMISGAVLIWNLSQSGPQQPDLVQGKPGIHGEPGAAASAGVPANIGEPGASAPGGVPVENGTHTQTIIARLTRTVDATWDQPEAPSDGATLAAQQKLILKQGLAEIAFTTGATVILEGPAEFAVGSRKSEVGTPTSPTSDLRPPLIPVRSHSANWWPTCRSRPTASRSTRQA